MVFRKARQFWNNTLSNGLHWAPQKGVYADDLDIELERLYTEHLAPPCKDIRAGVPGSRATIRRYCSQVWKAAGLWDRIQKSARVAEFTFPGDPMRTDYSYGRKWHARLGANPQRFTRSHRLQALRIHCGPHCNSGAFRVRVFGGY